MPGLEAAWISDGRRSWLVDAWVVRALDRPALALRATAPLTVGAAELAGLELHLGTAELIGAGRPLRARGVLAGGDVVLVQAYYKWPTIVRLPGFNLQDQVDGTRLLGAVRVFRNEPFGCSNCT